MSLGSPSVPNTPSMPLGGMLDPFSLAGQQQGYNTAAGVMSQAGSMMNMNTPGWNQTYQQIGTGPGGVPIYGINQALNNPGLYDLYQQNQAGAAAHIPYLSNMGQAIINNNLPALWQERQNYLQPAQNALTSSTNLWNDQVFNTLQGGSNPALHSAQNFANQYGNQNPNQIGDMASGLTGQRMDAAVAGIKPFQVQQRNELDTKLKNQGLHPGMPGYDTAMRELDNSQNLAISTFMSQFQPQAWQQATQIYQDPLSKQAAQQQAATGWQQQAGAFGGAAQGLSGIGQQYLNAANNAGNMGIQYGNLGLNTISQGLPWLAASAPTLPPAPQATPLNIQPSNIAGLGSAYNQSLQGNYANQLAAYNAQNQQHQNMLSGLFGIGSSALGALSAGGLFSDRRFKEDINYLTTLPNGINIYSFVYTWGGPTIVGPMADEVERIMPEAVSTHDGMKIVNYAQVMG